MSLPSDRFLVGPKETVSISNIRALAATKSERAGWNDARIRSDQDHHPSVRRPANRGSVT